MIPMQKRVLHLLWACALLLLPWLVHADFQQTLEQRLSGERPMADQTLYAAGLMQRMYELNGQQPLWQDRAIDDLMQAVDSLAADGLTPADYRFPELAGLLERRASGSLMPDELADLDLLLTESFARAVYNLYFGKVDAERLDSSINFLRTLEETNDPATWLLGYIQEGQVARAFEQARPKNIRYRWLQDALARYRTYAAAGGWQALPDGELLKPGQRDPRVSALRDRLAITGDLSDPANADPEHFDVRLESAVKGFQQRHGLQADGVVGPSTLAALNVPVQARIEQIRVNLERQRWIMHEAYDEFLVVDIAGFQVYWIKDDEIVWQEPTQVGKEYTQTPVFKDHIRYLEFNPTWTIPPGIIKRTVLPNLKKNPDYLAQKGYRLLTLEGKSVDPATVNWQDLKGFPYMVRQPPGPDNALGLVKFMFPNPHYVFLHDTNHRELFDRTRRTFSSGCVRVRNPFDLAERLLTGQDGWDRGRIEQVVASGKTTRVNLERPLRILITYSTAMASQDQVYFKPDIYQRDAPLLTALNGAFQVHRRDRKTAQR
jgi:murein L,D-transpeptidase YcbB/YkuD